MPLEIDTNAQPPKQSTIAAPGWVPSPGGVSGSISEGALPAGFVPTTPAQPSAPGGNGGAMPTGTFSESQDQPGFYRLPPRQSNIPPWWWAVGLAAVLLLGRRK